MNSYNKIESLCSYFGFIASEHKQSFKEISEHHLGKEDALVPFMGEIGW